MKIYKVTLDGRQYAMLEKMLCSNRAGSLARNQNINGYELFFDIFSAICSPVTDGWSTYEVVLEESEKEIALLRFMTKQVFPEDEDFFVKQIGKKFDCKKDFEFEIILKF